ncbi:helix-turn-helix transcriptional regulator [Pseudomonas fluorescens]|uniref:helix-turn-helix transcriptional regulator n=1 Tax=Pseudomonas fluorescens TaxID=294 RepID=UPI0007320D2F|nr:autoinducer binding domain-containing protein [Pseudomonas fluorescens]
MDKHHSPACGRTQAERAATLTAFTSLAKDANRCDWERLLNKVLRQLGFGSYLISLGPTAPRDTDPLAGLITTFPKHWLEHYRCDGLIEIDPILRHCRRELVPLFWDSERRRARGRSRHFWEQREQHGLRSGVSIPLRYEMLRGTLSVAFDDTQITEQKGFSNPAVYQLFMLIPYLLAGIRHQLHRPAQPRQDLTPKEMDCLYWASEGKTTWEISHILTCSERTIDFHLLNARRKLGSVSRQQAVSAAVACGLVMPTAGSVRDSDRGFRRSIS